MVGGFVGALFTFIVIIFSAVLHEVAHGAMAFSLGDNTAKDAGRLTLNPIKHLDMFGSVLLPLFLLLIGSPFLFGYAKPVPYNPLNLSDRKHGPAKVAMAGPLTNIALALLFGVTIRLIPGSFTNSIVLSLFSQIAYINLLLAIFNLMPVPPLDGHWLFITFLPSRFDALKVFVLRYSLIIFFVFLIFIFPILVPLINFLFRVIVGS